MNTRLIPSILALAAACLATNEASAQLLINGAGATFPYPIYSKWFDEYSRVDPSVRFNYQSIGSGGGQRQIVEGTVDFGASDGPMSDADLAKAKSKILHVPTVAGADVVTYNLPGSPPLQLDGPAVAGIFLGKITKWNDPAIAAANPGVKLPNSDIVVVHRSDGSGTTFIFVDYLSSISPEWETNVGRGTAVKWPAGLGSKGNEGVTGQIKQTPGAIGYVELAYAVQNKLPYASVKNAACLLRGAFHRVGHGRAGHRQDTGGFSLLDGQSPRRCRLSHRWRHLAVGLSATNRPGQRRQTGPVPQMGDEGRGEDGPSP